MAVDRRILMVIQKHVLQCTQGVWVESRVLEAPVFEGSVGVIEVELGICWRMICSRKKRATTMV